MFIDYIAGGRLIIGLIASLHVLINHPLAVGVYPILTYLEWSAFNNKNKDLDNLAYKITFIVFIVTTSVGALSGVGIWVTTALFSPFAIGSLLRVFFWGWFAEWLVFISEVILIMWWFLAWNNSDRDDDTKVKHIRIGIALSIMSWLTMALIVTVLGFMMKPGEWNQTRALWDAMTNPLYLPQLGFRTFFSLMTGAIFIWFASFFFTKNQDALRNWLVYRLSFVTLFSLLMTLGFGIWYWSRIPVVMQANSSVALLTQEFAGWHSQFYWLLAITVFGFLIVSLGGIFFSKRIPRYALLIPTFMGIWLLGHFERSREFMRKPWVIGEYLYSSGIRKEELAFFQEKGILPYATFVSHREVTAENKIEAGKDVFMLTCSRCHATLGINGIINKFHRLYGDKDWDPDAMAAFIRSMHASRSFMPPFPGNNAELDALVAYVRSIKDTKTPLVGAQARGASLPDGENSRLTFRFEEGYSNDSNATFIEGVGVGH